MKQLLLFMLLLTGALPVMAQREAPYKYFVDYEITVPNNSPVNSIMLILTEADGGGRIIFYEVGGTLANGPTFKDRYWSTEEIRDIVISTQGQTISCYKDETWSINSNYNMGYVLHATTCDNIPDALRPVIHLQLFPTSMIRNVDRTNPADNVYCANEKINLNQYYTGALNGNYPQWQYRVESGDFQSFPVFTGTTYDFSWTLMELFGSNYLDYVNKRIDFRATNQIYYSWPPDEDTYRPVPGDPEDGTNILSYFFLPLTPQPQQVSAVLPKCSDLPAEGLTIKFDRPLIADEQITVLTVFKVLPDNTGDLHDQYQVPVTALDGTNTFTWSNIKPMLPGRYYMNVEAKVANQLECNKTNYYFTVTAPDPVTISSAVPQHIQCFGASTGTITVTPSGGQGGGTADQYDYSKDDGATWQLSDNVFRNLAKGTYTIRVRDKNECVSADSQAVTINAPTAALKLTLDGFADPKGSGTNDGYINTTASNGTPPYSYSWSNGGSTDDINGLGGGDFTLTVTDANGCTQQQTTPLIEPDAIVITINETPISCNGRQDGILSASATGGVGTLSYSWNNGRDSATISGLGNNSYAVTVTDENNISATLPYDLLQPAPLAASLQPEPVLCNGQATGSIALSVSGGTPGYTYAWSNSSHNDRLEQIGAGNYQVTVTDNRSCTAIATTEVTAPLALGMNAVVNTPTRYQATDGSIDITPQGGTTPYDYQWSTGATTANIGGLGDGAYQVALTDSNGCRLEQTFIIKQPDPLIATITEEVSVLCNGTPAGSLYARVNGGVRPYTYTWSDANTDSLRRGVTAGSYSVLVTDKSGVQAQATYTITEPPALTLALQASQVSCSGEKDGTVTSTAGGGIPPYAYIWSNGATTPALAAVNGGTYLLQVTDANGCIITGSAIVQAPNALAIANQVKQPTCYGYSDGAVTLTTSGGRLPYRFTWSTGALTANITDLPAGYYKVTLEDNSGCKISQDYNLVAPPPLTVNIGADKTLCIGQSFTLNAAIPQGVTYEWNSSNGFTAATPAVTVSQAGTYQVKVASLPGCIARDTMLIGKEEREVDANFLVSTQAYKGETVIIANVSYPVADSIHWMLPPGAVVANSSSGMVELSFPNSGKYNIGMTAFRGNCSAFMAKDLMVVDTVLLPDVNTAHKSLFKQVILRPNPNSGQFYVDVEVVEDVTVNYRFIDITRNRTVYEKRSQLSKAARNTEQFNIPGLPAGVYILLLENAKERKTLKVMIL